MLRVIVVVVDIVILELLGPLFFLRLKKGPRVGEGLHKVAKSIRNVDFKFNLTEKHWQGHGEVALGPESNMSVTGLQVLKGQNALAKHLVVVVIHGKPQDGQFW